MQDNKDLWVRANVICVGRSYYTSDTYLSVQLKVTNKSSSVKTFVMYTTSWQDSFVADKEYVEICKVLYPGKNIPKEVNLRPNDSIFFNCILRITGMDRITYSFRIGLVYADYHQLGEIRNDGIEKTTNSYEALIIRRNNKLKHQIFWSQDITDQDEPRGYDPSKVFMN